MALAEISLEDRELKEADFYFVWDEDQTISLEPWQVEEITACTLDCRYFIETFCWIERKETGEILPFVPYDWQWDILERLQNGESIVISKSRRVGVSWIVAAYVAWLINFREGHHVLFLSRTENDAIKLLRKVKFILNNLALHDTEHIRDATQCTFLRGEIQTDKQQFFSIQYRDDDGNAVGASAAESLTMTTAAGRSEGASLVFWDEAAFAKPDDEATWSSIAPTITRGGQVIVASTPFGVGGVFWRLVRDGERGDNTWYHFRFVHWSESGMTEEQVMRIKDALKMTNEMYLQEFEGKFTQAGTRVFDATYLDMCYRPLDEHPEIAQYLENYDQTEGFYYSAADSASGQYHKKRAPDENAWVSVTRHGVTAMVEHNRKLLGDWAGKPITNSDGTPGFQQGEVSNLHKQWPGILYIEKKIAGDVTYNNYQGPEDGISRMYPANPDTKSMPRIMNGLILLIEGAQLIITDKELYQQMYDLQRGVSPGTYEPPPGGNDDLVKTLAWAADAMTTHGGADIPEGIRLPDPNRESHTGYIPSLAMPQPGIDPRSMRMTDTIGGPGPLPVPTIRVPAPRSNIDWMRPKPFGERS